MKCELKAQATNIWFYINLQQPTDDISFYHIGLNSSDARRAVEISHKKRLSRRGHCRSKLILTVDWIF